MTAPPRCLTRTSLALGAEALAAADPDLARWLVEQGIDSLSLNPDAVVETWLYLANGAKT